MLDHHLTVGDLLKFIKEHNIPMDAPVLMQRVEDVYFEKYGWKVHKKPGFHYWSACQINMNMLAELYRRNSGDEPEYEMDDPTKYIASEEDLEKMKEEYYEASCPVFYKDEPNALFLDAHY